MISVSHVVEEQVVGSCAVVDKQRALIILMDVFDCDHCGEKLTDHISLFFFRQLFLIINLRRLLTIPQLLSKRKGPQQIISAPTFCRRVDPAKPFQLAIYTLRVLLTE